MTLNSGTVTLTNARVPAAAMGRIGDGSLHTVDIEIVAGTIAAIRPTGSAPVTGPAHDMDKGLVLPAFVDIHTRVPVRMAAIVSLGLRKIQSNLLSIAAACNSKFSPVQQRSEFPLSKIRNYIISKAAWRLFMITTLAEVREVPDDPLS